MLAVEYVEEKGNELEHHYIIYEINAEYKELVTYRTYVTDWSKDLSVDELRKISGIDSLSGIFHTSIRRYFRRIFENKMIEHLDYFKFVEEEFKKGKSIEQIDAEWSKQQKIDAITEAAKEFT